ncbi:MAG: cell division protein SepF [Defluviitaleaceae bacterium]|nr:cell division protein SepF [Defluviitaleaceae bacterium]
MVGIFKKLSEKLSNKMLAPGAEEHDGYYEDDYERNYYEDDYDQDDYYDEPEPLQVRYTQRSQQPRKSSAKSSSSALSTRSSSTSARKDNVYGFAGAINVHKQSESFIMHPKSMEDAVEIGSHVRSGRMCIVDLTGVPTAEAQRIADYLCGNTDALDGAINRINNTMITVSPPNHRVMTDYREESPFEASFFQKKAANDR